MQEPTKKPRATLYGAAGHFCSTATFAESRFFFLNLNFNRFRNGVSSLSDEEIEKKFQELGLAFRTDSMTLSKRLKVRKRQRDQAEINVETEVKFMKEKLDVSIKIP